jgi:hypothetical protein
MTVEVNKSSSSSSSSSSNVGKTGTGAGASGGAGGNGGQQQQQQRVQVTGTVSLSSRPWPQPPSEFFVTLKGLKGGSVQVGSLGEQLTTAPAIIAATTAAAAAAAAAGAVGAVDVAATSKKPYKEQRYFKCSTQPRPKAAVSLTGTVSTAAAAAPPNRQQQQQPQQKWSESPFTPVLRYTLLKRPALPACPLRVTAQVTVRGGGGSGGGGGGGGGTGGAGLGGSRSSSSPCYLPGPPLMRSIELACDPRLRCHSLSKLTLTVKLPPQPNGRSPQSKPAAAWNRQASVLRWPSITAAPSLTPAPAAAGPASSSSSSANGAVPGEGSGGLDKNGSGGGGNGGSGGGGMVLRPGERRVLQVLLTNTTGAALGPILTACQATALLSDAEVEFSALQAAVPMARGDAGGGNGGGGHPGGAVFNGRVSHRRFRINHKLIL